MVLQTQLGLNQQQAYSHEQNYYSDSNHGQMMRPSGYCSTMPFSQSTHNSHMMGHGGHYGSHGHGHGHYGSHGHHGHMPHDSTNFSSSTTMVHNDGGYGSGMQQSSHAHMSSMGATGHHGHGYGGSHPSGYGQSQNFNWAHKNMDD
ncbi:uncharacterized protein LOC132066601 [Lycium ferocissimum]|uniref:uncharacterized protein LOC132066601 n=1 Tax=Lycium ferocissimum TaxID=112874 RepID=UPI002814FCD3|nr:uncharacterized protein LOC132066601 [Lycium ferocissimum]